MGSVVKQGVGPMGKTFAIHEEDTRGGDISTLAALVERAGKNPAEARQELRRLIEQIPDADLQNFIGAQVAVVT
jgi:hypothetical protein